MRGHTDRQDVMYYTINIEKKVRADHPLRAMKRMCDGILEGMRADFRKAYSRTGRPSVPPEQLLKAMLLQALYSIRSEIQLAQAIDFNMLYRWFLDMPLDAEMWTPEVFSVNRERFAEHDLVRKFFDRIVADALDKGLVSDDHFSVDGTLIRSWASLKSLKPKDPAQAGPETRDDDPGNPTVDFRNTKRANATHQSATDPEALLAKRGKGKEAHLCHSGHALMENRHGLCVDVVVEAADGGAERRAARAMLKRVKRRHRLWPRTLGADKGYDDGEFLRHLERTDIKPHVPIRTGPIRATDEAGEARRRARSRMRTKGYRASQWIRKRVEEIFGWAKTVGGLARARFVGRWKIGQQALITGAAYNLLRMSKILAAG